MSYDELIKKIDELIADLSKNSYALTLDRVNGASISNNVFRGGGLRIGVGQNQPSEEKESSSLNSENIDVKNNYIESPDTAIKASNVRNLNVDQNIITIKQNEALQLLTELKSELTNKNENKSQRKILVDKLIGCAEYVPKIVKLVSELRTCVPS